MRDEHSHAALRKVQKEQLEAQIAAEEKARTPPETTHGDEADSTLDLLRSHYKVEPGSKAIPSRILFSVLARAGSTLESNKELNRMIRREYATEIAAGDIREAKCTGNQHAWKGLAQVVADY